MKASIAALESASWPRSSAVGQQDQHVDVGMREQLAAPEAADRQQRGAGGHAGGVPQARAGVVGIARPARCSEARGCRACRRGLAAKRSSSAALRVAKAFAQLGQRRAGDAAAASRRGAHDDAGALSSRHAAFTARSHEGRRRRAAGRQREHLVAGLGDQHRVLPLRRQGTVLGDDGPAVAPSPRGSRAPALIIGSMVKVMPGFSSSSVPGRP